MTTAGDGSHVTASGIVAAIPASIIAAIIRRDPDGLTGAAPVDVDALGLELSIPADAVRQLLAAAFPDRSIDVSFQDGVINASIAGLPPVRIRVPDRGLRLRVGADGLSIGGGRGGA